MPELPNGGNRADGCTTPTWFAGDATAAAQPAFRDASRTDASTTSGLFGAATVS